VTFLAEPVTACVPATSANLGPGFDSFGLALSLHDSVTVRVTPAGLAIEVTGEGAGAAGAGEQHLVVRAMRTAFARLGAQPPGLALSCRNTIPQGFGLGSSAGAICAGLLAARALAGPDGRAALPDEEILRLASRLEGHPDNVAACLSGGLTIAWNAGAPAPAGTAEPAEAAAPAGPRVARLTPLPGITPVLCVPAVPMSTLTARQVLPADIPHAAAAANSARAALLVAALTSQPDLLLDATEDFLHQPYRAAAMPGTARLVAALRAAGIPAVVSGAGPSVLALTMGESAEVAAIAAADGNGRAASAAVAPGAVAPGAVASAAVASGAVAPGAVAPGAVASGTAGWRVLPLRIDTAGATAGPVAAHQGQLSG
jgi:homoserine kinase